jgi:4-hydroxy-tetrahydrodipicolinate synthase
MSASVPTKPRPFGAVGIAMVTPLTPDGSAPDLDAAQELATYLVARGTDTLVLSGTTGESPTTTDGEKVDLVRAVREAVGPQVRLVAGVGSNDTAHSIRLARAHADVDIDGLLVVTPYYSKPSQEGIIAHVSAVAATSDLPVMLYDIPGRTGVPLHEDTILRLSEVPTVAAVKDAKGDLLQATRIMQRTDLAYYSGEDALNLPWLAIGASGIVSVVGHAAPALEAELVAAVDAGDLPRARIANERLALVLQGALPHAAVRGPHVPASEQQVEKLRAALAGAQGIDPVV